MGRLIIVSNRLPVTVSITDSQIEIQPASGGLATGVRGPHEKFGGIWIGWPGDTSSFTGGQRVTLKSELSQMRLVPCELSTEEVESYYNRFSNGVHWALFHYLHDRIPLTISDWESYRAVNEKFADLVAANYEPGDTIWVHDYQLALVPALIRERIPKAKIGYFLHIPFPATETMRLLPWRKEFLLGLLGADVVGFHTLSYARHFANSLIHILGLTPNVDYVRFEGRMVKIGAFPMGVDAKGLSELASRPEISRAAQQIREENHAEYLFLGVDRLDYTKGIPRRLLAFERMLEKNPDLHGKVCLIQLAVPSRTQVSEYEAFAASVNQLVGRINGAFSTASSVPVHYLYRNVPIEELVALYRAASVMLVTPLCDGMNLVSKEYVASRVDEDGVLVLSEFAGAASELGDALIVNPYDIDEMADTFKRAIELPELERKARMRALRGVVSDYDVHTWADSFVEELLGSSNDLGFTEPRLVGTEEKEEILRVLSGTEQNLLLLDYDGTLVPFAVRPEWATPDSQLLSLLHDLGKNQKFAVHIVSGRPKEFLEECFKDIPVNLHAEHGLWSRLNEGEWIANYSGDDLWKGKAIGILKQFCRRTPGSIIEEKSASLAWHYRRCDAEFGEWQSRELKIHLTHVLSNVPVSILSGDHVIELQPHQASKGVIASGLVSSSVPSLSATGGNPVGVICAGDDETDEAMFAALPSRAITIHVGNKVTCARFRIQNHFAMRRLLEQLLNEYH
ncbi:MAG: bifunctional alpha,alpha-trehalose-phosphate synthase (UDP-forming)/trehalose-phosphatase [Nitrospirales bacterium]|nr:MAG: bifunctional alpha,alpha-trehalose-phosphate synthase (UDP-forming)/trehalose-phosphatase [Nitrospirales bacterium]